MSIATELRARIQQREIIIAPGIYDALSAYRTEAAGFEAVFASGSSLAATHLGRPDIGLLSLTETTEIVGRISLLIDIMDPQRPAASLLEQAGDMARASSGGAVLTDYKSAMILTLEPGKRAVEEIGELQTAHRPLSMWSLA